MKKAPFPGLFLHIQKGVMKIFFSSRPAWIPSGTTAWFHENHCYNQDQQNSTSHYFSIN